MRSALLALAAAALVGLSGEARSEAPRASYQYAGTVRSRSDADHVVTVETRHGLLDFFYRPLGPSQCAQPKALKHGDAVQVLSPTGRAPYEASCIIKLTVPGGVR